MYSFIILYMIVYIYIIWYIVYIYIYVYITEGPAVTGVVFLVVPVVN